MTVEISSLSKQYVTVPVTYTDDVTGNTVEFAFTQGAEPVEADWASGDWDGAATAISASEYRQTARALVGPATDFVLTDGWWFAWLRVTASPEVPVLKAGSFLVT